MARILIAEDEEGLRTLVARALALDGHDVMTANDGAEALDLLTRSQGAFELPADVDIFVGQDVGKRLYDRYFRAERAVEVAELHANRAAPDDDDRGRHAPALKGCPARDHALAVYLNARQGAGVPAGGDDYVLSVDFLTGRFDAERVGTNQRRLAVHKINLVLL